VTPRRCLVPLALALVLLVLPPSAGAYVFFGGADSIGRVDNDGTGADPNFIAGADPFGPLAVDATHLYYTTDQEGMAADPIVGRTNFDGGEATTLPDGSSAIAAPVSRPSTPDTSTGFPTAASGAGRSTAAPPNSNT
jgi:hypothetical protein